MSGVRLRGAAQEALYLWVRATAHPRETVRNHRFMAPRRRFELDVAIPGLMLAFEVDGMGIGHQGIKGFLRDREKELHAEAEGWRLVRVAAKHIDDDTAWPLLERILRRHMPGGAT